MESPGEYLKREREHRGVSLESIFAATRVPLDLLEAIESDNFEAQHPTFMKGFIRSYCKHLGLDENDAVLRYELFIKEQQHKADTGAGAHKKYDEVSNTVIAAEGSSRRNILILAVLGAAAILLFYLFSPMLSERKETGKPPVAVEVQAPETAVVEAAKAPEPVAVVPAVAPVLNDSAIPKTVENEVPAASNSIEISGHTLTVKAVEEVWIETWVDGAKPVDVILKPGEKIERNAENGVYVVIGNAGGVEINFDGELIELFGHSGKVVRLKLPSDYVFKLPPRKKAKSVKPVPVASKTSGAKKELKKVQEPVSAR